MSLQLGQEKSLCVPPTIPMNLGAGKRLNQQMPNGLQADSKQLGTAAAPSSPKPTIWQRSQTDVGLQTEDQQSPLRSLGTNQPLRVFAQIGEAGWGTGFWLDSSASSSWTALDWNTTYIRRLTQSGPQNREELICGPWKQRETENAKGFAGTMPVSYCLWSHQRSPSVLLLTVNLLKNYSTE